MSIKQSKLVMSRRNNFRELSENFDFRIQESIFGVLYVLLKDDESSIYFFLFNSFTEFLEFLQFPFNETFKIYWNSTIANSIMQYLNYLNIVTYFPTTAIELYLIVFYFFVLAVSLVILNIVYVSYSFSRKFFTYTWPLYVLAKVVKIFVTNLFMPIFELFLSIYKCQLDSSGQHYVNSVTSGMICFQGFHYVHMAISIVISIIFVVICIVCAINFFECSEISEEFEAKENSRADIVQILCKLFLTIIYSFFNNADYNWFLILLVVVLSGWQFIKHYTEKPNYNRNIQLYLSILNGIYFWTSIVMMIAFIFHDYGFQGSFYLWIFGVPMIIVLLYLKSDDTMSALSGNFKQFEKGEDYQNYIRYFLKLFDEKNKEAEVILKGFIYSHEESCEIIECPLREYRNSISREEYGIDSTKKQATIEDYLFMFAEKVFNIGLSKFPYSTSLRIKYGIFQWERLKNKNQALQQLSIAEKFSPPLDLRFVIFRYRKIISEEEESKTYVGETLDLVSGIAYESHYKQCFFNIEKSTQIYMDFWELLLNTNTTPDINKLNELGLKINTTHNSIEVHWKSMQSLKPNDPKALKLYSGWLLNVLNDKLKGNELLQLWKESIDKKQANVRFLNMNLDDSIMNLVKEGSALLICHLENDKKDKNFGLITKATSSASKIFGYFENEILGKPISFLFLDIYSDSINNYIQKSLTKKKGVPTRKSSNSNAVYRDSNPEENLNLSGNDDVASKFLSNNKNSQQTNYSYNKTLGDFFFGKTKYQKAIPLNFKIIDLCNHLHDEKIFACIFTLESSLIDVKLFIKSSYFIVNSSLKIATEINTMSTIEVLNSLGRKVNEVTHSLLTLFPELLKKNQAHEDEERLIEIHDDRRESILTCENANLMSSQMNSKMKTKKSQLPPKMSNADYDKRTKRSTNNVEFISKRSQENIKLIKAASRMNLDTIEGKNKRVKISPNQIHESIQNEKEILDLHLTKTILKCSHDPQSLLIRKSLDLAQYITETEEIKDISLNEEDHMMVDCYPGECSFFPLSALNKIKTIDSGNKEKDLKYEAYYCFSLKIQMKNTNYENNINFATNNSAAIYMNFDKLFTTVKSELKNEAKLQLLSCIKKSPGGIANFYDLHGDSLKDSYFKFNSRNYLSNTSDSSQVKDNLNKYLDNEESELTNSKDVSIISSSSIEKKEKIKVGLASLSILNSNHERMTAEELKHQIDLLHEYSQKIILKLVIGDKIGEEETFPSSAIKDIAKHKYTQTNSDEVTFVSKSSLGRTDKLIAGGKSSKKDNKKEVPRILKYLSLSSLGVFCFILMLALLKFFFKKKVISYIDSNYYLIDASMKALNCFQDAGLLLRNLVQYNKEGYEKNDFYDFNINVHLSELALIQEKLNEISQNYTLISIPKSDTIDSAFTDKQTLIAMIEGTNDTLVYHTYTYLHAFKVQTSFLLYLEPNSPKTYRESNRYINQFLYNNYNDFYFKSFELSNLFSFEIDSLISWYIVLLIIWVFVAFVIYVLLSLIITSIISKVEMEKTKILESFYRIPLFYVKYLSDLCGSFIIKLQKNQISDDNCSEEEGADLLVLDIEEIESNYISDKKKLFRRHLNLKVASTKFEPGPTFSKLIIFVLFFITFFVLSVLNIRSLKVNNSIALNYGQTYSNYSLAFNSLREYRNNPSMRLFNQNYPILKDVLFNHWIQTTLASNEIFNYALIYSKEIKQEYLDKIFEIVYNSICFNADFSLSTACNGQPQVKIQSDYGLRLIINNFIDLLSSEFESLTPEIFKKMMLSDPIYLKSLDLLWRYMRTTFSTLNDYVYLNIQSQIQLEYDYNTIQIITFAILLLCAYLFFWLPFEYKINEDITRTQLMLNVLPDELLNSNQNLL